MMVLKSRHFVIVINLELYNFSFCPQDLGLQEKGVFICTSILRCNIVYNL